MFGLTIRTIKMGNNWVAVTQLAGITLRGKIAKDEQAAVHNLFFELAASGTENGDNAALAVGLALSNTTMDNLLSDGSNSSAE